MHLFSRANQLTDRIFTVARMNAFSRSHTLNFTWDKDTFSDFITIYKSQSVKQYPDPVENKAKKPRDGEQQHTRFIHTHACAKPLHARAVRVAFPPQSGRARGCKSPIYVRSQALDNFPARAAASCLDTLSLLTSFLKGSSL